MITPYLAEQWATIPSRPGYEASDQGRIRSVDRISVDRNGRQFRLRGRVLANQVHPNGYVSVGTGARYRTGWVHRLVLEAFAGPCPDLMEACHGLGGQADNRLTNLRWGTRPENVADTVQAGNHAETRKTHCPARHPLRVPNLVRSELPRRKCKACNRARALTHRLHRNGAAGDFQAIADSYFMQVMTEAGEAA